MSVFGGLYLTNQGKNLQIKCQAGAILQYTRVGIGDGTLVSGQSISDLTVLINEVKSLQIIKLSALVTGKAVIGVVLSNQDISTGFYFREIGVYAQDPDLGEILYCYGNAGANAEYIPAPGGADIIEKSIDIKVLTGNAENISAVIDGSLVYASKAELDTLSEKVDGLVKLTISSTDPQSAKANDIWLKIL